MANRHRGPAVPDEQLLELLHRITASLTTSIKPFQQQTLHLVPVLITPRSIVSNRIVVEMSLQHLPGLLNQCRGPVIVPLLSQPLIVLLQFGSKLLA